MRRSRLSRVGAILAAGLLVLSTFAGLVFADPGSDPATVPNGPWVTDTQDVSLEGLHSYDQIMQTLQQIEQSSQGAVQVITPPYAAHASGRALPAVKIGSGPKAMMIITQQHGDEYITTEGALNLIQTLAANSAEARAIREAVTLIVMPRVNVDGFDYKFDPPLATWPYETPWRYNVDLSASGAYSRKGHGYDINRYHPEDLTTNPYKPGELNPVTEALAVRALFEQYKPSVFMDMHHQATYVDTNGEMVTAATLWPTSEGVDPAVVTRAKQVVATLYTNLQQYGYANVAKYPGGPEPGIARNRYGLLGTAAVLVEIRGDQAQKSQGYIARTAYQAMMSVVEALASGSLDETDPAIADSLPERGDDVYRELPSNGEEEAEGA